MQLSGSVPTGFKKTWKWPRHLCCWIKHCTTCAICTSNLWTIWTVFTGCLAIRCVQGELNAAKHGLDTSGLCSGSGGLWDGFGREVFQGLGVSNSVIQRLLERFQTMYSNKLHGRPTECRDTTTITWKWHLLRKLVRTDLEKAKHVNASKQILHNSLMCASPICLVELMPS